MDIASEDNAGAGSFMFGKVVMLVGKLSSNDSWIRRKPRRACTATLAVERLCVVKQLAETRKVKEQSTATSEGVAHSGS